LIATIIGAMRKHRRQLDASVGASGPHAFIVRADAARLTAPARPPHPATNVCDVRDTPLREDAGRHVYAPFPNFWKAKYFGQKGLTATERIEPRRCGN
jgi:hypothetical protein